ncbi:MAG: CPCC family cysteine-rich protein [Clostridia bacterium]|nr:CPCC family cysteine-rich protein [Clostridia bacterium]
MKKYKCPCCGKYTLELKPTNTFQECDVCHWVDDGVQYAYHDKPGFNKMSLNEARKAYKEGREIY